LNRDDIEIAHGMTFDVNDVQCGREEPIYGEQMGNLTARGTHLFYTVKRLGDPLIHIPGSASSRTACNYPVVAMDDVDAVDGRVVTCVRCMTAWRVPDLFKWVSTEPIDTGDP
jgi:hypothetical protein